MKQPDNLFYTLFTSYKRLRLVAFLFFAICILAVSLTFFIISIGKPYMGITLSRNHQGWTVERIGPNGLASQAGIREGDKPVMINGEIADIFLERYGKSGLVLGKALRELTVVDRNGQLKSVALEGSTLSWQGLSEQIARLFASLIFWIIGFYVLLKSPRSIASRLLCLVGLFFGLMFSSNMAWVAGISIGAYFDVLATAIGSWLLLHFFLVLPEEREGIRNNPLLYAIYLPGLVSVALFISIGYSNDQPVLWLQNVRYLQSGVALLLATGVAVYNYFGSASVKTRQQMKIIAVACFAALIPNVLLYLIPQVIWGESILPPEFSIMTFAFIPVGMGYAVVTQKLLDIDVVIRRGVIYGLITLTMATILSVAITTIIASHILVGIGEKIVIGLVLGIIATTLFGPIRNGAEFVADKVFYKDRYDYRQIIKNLTTSLNSIHDMNGISRLIVGVTALTLNLAGCCLFIKAQSGSLEIGASQGIFTKAAKQKHLLTLASQRNRTIEFPNSASSFCSDLAFLLPLFSSGEKEVGIFYMSQKASRQDFSSNDMYLLQEIGSIAAISLHSAMLTRDVSIRDTFVSVASHELRTPLTSVVGYADLLLRRDPPGDIRKRWLKHILDNSQRVSAMVDDLLNVSRIQSGRISLKLESVRLSEILEGALSLAHEMTKKHEFVVDLEPALPDVLVDRDKFGQVIGNLLSNAVKYSPDGGCITLSAHNESTKNRIVVSVADEGVGIGPKDKESLFMTFHRIQRPETRSVRGSGLGLYIAKEWTGAMGGKIWLKSKLNKGSTFFVAIPTQHYSETD